MKRFAGLMAGAAVLAGCGARVGVAQPDLGSRVAAPVKVAAVTTAAPKAAGSGNTTLVANASTNLAPTAGDVGSNASFDMKPFKDATGLIGRFATFTDQNVNYSTQLIPGDTQFKADQIAKKWADDSKQVYIGWGFWKSTLLAQTQHFYYSPSKKKKYIITFKLTSFKHTTAEEDAPKFDLANKVLKGAADIHSWNGRLAHSQAKKSGYTPGGRNEVGVLIHPLVLGPMWVWLDNEDHQYPLMAVKAHSGAVVRDGLEMMAIRYMFQQK